jgi:leucyl-tRNA synthetase
MSREGIDDIDVKSFQEKIFNYTESFKFNKVVSEFMTLVNKERTKNLKPEIKKELISILEIYIPDIRNLIF